MTIHMADDQCVIESRSFANLRVRSRPATISDCTCFLRPGIDVCFLSSLRHVEGSDFERKEPVSQHAFLLTLLASYINNIYNGVSGFDFTFLFSSGLG